MKNHRERLRKRFEASGTTGFHDYEIIELLLTFVIPRKDTKQTAKDLISEFSSIGGIINSEKDRLKKYPGITDRGAMLFSLIKEISGICLREKFSQGKLIQHREDVENYLRFNFSHKRVEFIAGVFLDGGNRIIETEILAEGAPNQCMIYPRTVIKKALEIDAVSIILAHNHPGGSLSPSDSDWRLTHRMQKIGSLLEVPLLDHLIILPEKIISLREMSRWNLEKE